VPSVGAAQGGARFRDRRRGCEGGRSRAPSQAGVGGPRPALGRGLEVSAHNRGHEAREVMWNVGKSVTCVPMPCSPRWRWAACGSALRPSTTRRTWPRKDLRAGEDVIVLRAGDVIPQVVSPAPHVAEHKRRPPRPHPPAHCPFCNTRTIKPQDGVFTKCPNPVCPARLWQLLKHFVSRGAMDIDGLGRSRSRSFRSRSSWRRPVISTA